MFRNTNGEIISVVTNHMNGGKTQGSAVRESGNDWVDIKDPAWDFVNVKYRVKPEPASGYAVICGSTLATIHDTKEEAEIIAKVGECSVIKMIQED